MKAGIFHHCRHGLGRRKRGKAAGEPPKSQPWCGWKAAKLTAHAVTRLKQLGVVLQEFSLVTKASSGSCRSPPNSQAG